MYSNKLIGYVINKSIKEDKKEMSKEEPDFQKVGLCGILNYLNSTNPKKRYFGID